MNIYKKMYKAKKKRAVDPNAPPRPTLLGQVKVIKDVQTGIDQTKSVAQQQQAQINKLQADLRRANHRIELLTNIVRDIKK